VRNHYRTLSLHHDASPDEIQRAYRALAREHHPDRNPNAGAAAEMIRINEAYEWLSDPDRRLTYDKRFVAAEPTPLQLAALDAVRDDLRGGGRNWIETGGGNGVIGRGRDRIWIQFLCVLAAVEFTDWVESVKQTLARGLADYSVCVAYRVLDADELHRTMTRSNRPMTAIDLVESRSFGAPISVPAHRELFERFLME